MTAGFLMYARPETIPVLACIVLTTSPYLFLTELTQMYGCGLGGIYLERMELGRTHQNHLCLGRGVENSTLVGRRGFASRRSGHGTVIDFYQYRTVTGLFCFFLRCTFLPLAQFVSGLLLISRKLVPFLTISMFMIIVFAYFAVETTNRQNCAERDSNGLFFCSFDPALLKTLIFFLVNPKPPRRA